MGTGMACDFFDAAATWLASSSMVDAAFHTLAAFQLSNILFCSLKTLCYLKCFLVGQVSF